MRGSERSHTGGGQVRPLTHTEGFFMKAQCRARAGQWQGVKIGARRGWGGQGWRLDNPRQAAYRDAALKNR